MNNISFYRKSYEYLISKLHDKNYTDINEVNNLLNGVYSTDTFLIDCFHQHKIIKECQII